MSLALDLLEQAEHLVHLDLRKPKQANLRRGISSAYYALFHLLNGMAVERLIPGEPSGLAVQARRFASHAGMKKACETISKKQIPLPMLRLLPMGFRIEHQQIARAFIDLQEERHRADYDLSVIYTRAAAELRVVESRKAFSALERIRLAPETNVFLTALLFPEGWSR